MDRQLRLTMAIKQCLLFAGIYLLSACGDQDNDSCTGVDTSQAPQTSVSSSHDGKTYTTRSWGNGCVRTTVE